MQAQIGVGERSDGEVSALKSRLGGLRGGDGAISALEVDNRDNRSSGTDEVTTGKEVGHHA